MSVRRGHGPAVTRVLPAASTDWAFPDPQHPRPEGRLPRSRGVLSQVHFKSFHTPPFYLRRSPASASPSKYSEGHSRYFRTSRRATGIRHQCIEFEAPTGFRPDGVIPARCKDAVNIHAFMGFPPICCVRSPGSATRRLRQHSGALADDQGSVSDSGRSAAGAVNQTPEHHAVFGQRFHARTQGQPRTRVRPDQMVKIPPSSVTGLALTKVVVCDNLPVPKESPRRATSNESAVEIRSNYDKRVQA